MRRSSVVLGVGIFLTVVVVYLWVLSGTGYGSAHLQPQGLVMKQGDVHPLFGASIDAGSLTLLYARVDSRDPFASTTTDYLETTWSTYAELRAMGLEDPVPSWGETAKGRFKWVVDSGEGKVMVRLPFWAIVIPMGCGTGVVVRVLRKRERKMIEEGRQA